MTELTIINNKKKLKEILEFPISLVVSARSQSGKSVLLRKMLKEIWKDYSAIYILSPTCLLSDDWDEFKKKKYSKVIEFIDEPTNDFVEGLFEGMKELKTENPKLKDKILIIGDDITDMYNSQSAGNIMNKLAWCGRHVAISFIFACHKFIGLPTILRTNARQKLFFNIQNNREKEIVIDECSTATLPSSVIESILDEHAKDYNSIMIKDGPSESKVYKLSRDI